MQAIGGFIRLFPLNCVVRYGLHASANEPVSGEVEGIDLDFSILSCVHEANVAIGHYRLDLNMTVRRDNGHEQGLSQR